MSDFINRTPRTEDYYVVPNELSQNRALSFEARGMLIYLMSQFSGWRVNTKDLQQQCGKSKVYRILSELIKARYIQRAYIRDDKGRIKSVEYYVYDCPFPENQEMAKQEMANRNHIKYREVESKETTSAQSAGVGDSSAAVKEDTPAMEELPDCAEDTIFAGDVFEDKNLPGAEITPLIPDEKMPPPPDNRLVGVKVPVPPERTAAIPKNEFPRKGRIDIGKGEPARPPKPKTARQLMMDAILDAVGWKSADVVSWARITKTATALLKKDIDPALLAEWRAWNLKRDCGVVQNPEGIPATWPKFMAARQAKPAQRETPELNIQVDVEFQ